MGVVGVFACCVPGLLILGGVMWVKSTLVSSPSDLEKAKKEARAAGVPLNLDDLAPQPKVAAAQNAAPLYEKIAIDWQVLPTAASDAATEANKLAAGRPADTSKIDFFFQSNASLVKQVEQAADKPYCVFDDDVTNFVFDNKPQPMKRLGQLFVGRACMDRDAGKIDEAFRMLTVAARMSRQYGASRSMLPKLTQEATQRQIHREICRLVSKTKGSPETIAKSKQLLEALGPEPDTRQAALSDCVQTWMATNQPNILRGASDARTAELLADKDQLRTLQVKLLQYWTQAVPLMKANPADLRSEYLALKELRNRSIHSFAVTAEETEAFFSDYESMFAAEATDRASTLTVRYLLEILEARNQGSNLSQAPKMLSSTKDPFTGSPLKFRKTASGFVVYSIGKDEVDDGGSMAHGVDVVASYDPS
jgi:hypothetical protein